MTVLGSPQSWSPRGWPSAALDTVVGAGWGRVGAQVLGRVGVPLDGELAERLDPVLAALRRVRQDAALLLHDAGPPTSRDVAGAEAHLRRWLLLDAPRARRLVATLARPLWRAHVAAYVEGSALVRSLACASGDPVAARTSGCSTSRSPRRALRRPVDDDHALTARRAVSDPSDER